MIEISINYKPATSEWVVSEKVNGRFHQERSYYTNNPSDAVHTTLTKMDEHSERGRDVQLSNARATRELVERYAPGYPGYRLGGLKSTKKEKEAAGQPPWLTGKTKEISPRGVVRDVKMTPTTSHKSVRDVLVLPNQKSSPILDIKEPIPDDVKIMQPPPFNNPMYPLNPNSQ